MQHGDHICAVRDIMNPGYWLCRMLYEIWDIMEGTVSIDDYRVGPAHIWVLAQPWGPSGHGTLGCDSQAHLQDRYNLGNGQGWLANELKSLVSFSLWS